MIEMFSKSEKIIADFLKEKKMNYKYNDHLEKCLVKPNFLIEDYKLIIECDDLRWHNDLVLQDKKHHKKRQELFKKLGYKSLFFRSDEIFEKPDIVKSIILANTGIITNRIFARKCKVEKIKSKDSAIFFEENHLMGKGTGTTYVLKYENEIVCAMRVVNKKNYLDVSRFCNRINTVVVGGFSKILKQVIADYSPVKIVSFVDMRYGEGNSLVSLGFIEKTNNLSFKWTNFKNTYHRMSCRNNTGYEKGLFKIWDCGQKKFELELGGS